MPTGTPASVARKFHHNLTHFVSVPVVYAAPGAITIGKLPAGAAIVDAGIIITTPFAGGTPQTLTLGTAGAATGLSTALTLTAAGKQAANALGTSTILYQAADTDIVATLSAGATPSAGAGYAYVVYIIANRAAG